MAETAYVPRLREQFDKEIRGKLTEQFGYANVMQVPRVTKLTLNMGVGEAKTNAKLLDDAVEEVGHRHHVEFREECAGGGVAGVPGPT